MSDRFGAFLPGVSDPARRALEELRRRIAINIAAIATNTADIATLQGSGIASWTPTITQGSAVSGTTNYGYYVERADGTFMAHVLWTASAAGTGSNAVSVSLPVTLANASSLGGTVIFDDGGTITTGVAWGLSTTTAGFYVTGATGSAVFGLSPTTAIASGDVLIMTVQGRLA